LDTTPMDTFRKIAIVFANGNYPGGNLVPLEASSHDGKALFEEFNRHGFLSFSGFEVNYDAYQSTLHTAKRFMSEEVDLVVFVWCGHAHQHNGASKLVCVDGTSVDLQDTIAKLQSWAPRALTLVIQDGCRDEVQDPCNIQSSNDNPQDRCPLIMLFACGPLRTASESSEHGHLTQAVLNHLFKNCPLVETLEAIKQQVRNSTYKMQCPWTHDNCPPEEVLANPILYNSCCCSVRRYAKMKIDQMVHQLEEMHKKTKRARSESFSSWSPPPKPLNQGQHRRHWIVIDGNIGIGKTTLLESWSKIDPFFEVIKEPIDEWEDHLQNLSSKNTFKAQMKIWTHFNEIATKVSQSGRSVMSERGPLSVTDIFCAHYANINLLDAGDCKIFDSLRMSLQRQKLLPTCYIFLKATADTCHNRMMQRGRAFEKDISKDYLEQLGTTFEEVYEDINERMKDQRPGGAWVITIDANCSQEELLKRFMAEGVDV